MYTAYALLLHLLFFGVSAFSQNVEEVVQVREIPVELLGVEEPQEKEEWSNADEEKAAPPDGNEPPATAELQARQPQAKSLDHEEPQKLPEQAPIDVAEAIEAVDTNSKQIVYKRSIVERNEDPEEVVVLEQAEPIPRKQVSISAAASRAAARTGEHGVRRGKRGRSGLGEDFGAKEDVPVISGGAVFGTGRKGALKGSLCFVPAGTRRLSRIARCDPKGVMYTDRLNITPRRFTHGFPGVSSRFEWFAIDYNGHFSVSKSGVYKFRLHSDDGSLLWVDGKKIIDNDGLHAPQSRIGPVHLDEGKHRIRVFYFQGPRTKVALQLFVEPPGEAERLWTPNL